MIIGKLGKDKKESNEDFNIILEKIAKKVKVSEGKRAVEDVFRVIYREGKISTKKISQKTKLPLPIVAKIKSYLEREKFIYKGKLTEKGEELAKFLGLKYKKSLECPLCKGRGIVLDDYFKEILERVKKYFKERPTVNTSLDQSFATPETSVYRTALMYERGDLEGKDIIFIGDDDLTSLPTALTNFPNKVYVVDIDERLLNLIKRFCEKENVKIECIKHDLRKELPEKIKESFDIFSTDPPYTVDGLKLFLSRGIEALKDFSGVAYLSYSHKPIDEWLKIQEEITKMNFVITELIPKFNYYEGSEIIGNITFISRLVGKNLKPNIGSLDKLYTGLVKPVIRYYKCVKCGKVYKVGLNEKIKKVEDLICECGSKKFKLIKREKIKS
ncbi:bis-aminopropyl spermidine synthase family protein [Methanocaldococcus indicus]|uniref:bis-aminopropyl spermidine synthase family protein n=1 Tax=Methanocaldococcus indicus TaxID=213231 RepID=UPI003C6D5D8D